MHLSPDQSVFWQYGVFKTQRHPLSSTVGLMLVFGRRFSSLITRNLSTGLERSRWQNLLEIVSPASEKQELKT